MKHSVNDGFPYYIELAEAGDLKELFSSKENLSLLESLGEEKARYRYAPDKWSIKQLLGHITDHERIMIYRCLRFSRNDQTILPGYDQDLMVENSRFEELSFAELLTDFVHVRNASISFINGLSPEQLLRKGTAWRFELTVEEFLRATIGHELHHMEIIRKKYLH